MLSDEDKLQQALEGRAPDHRIVWAKPENGDPRALEAMGREMVGTLFALNCEWFQVTVEASRVVADGWYDRPEVQAAYESPPLLAEETGFSRDLTVEHRRTLRNIVSRTHREYFREAPTTRQLDELIDSIGPRVAHQMVRKATQAGHV